MAIQRAMGQRLAEWLAKHVLAFANCLASLFRRGLSVVGGRPVSVQLRGDRPVIAAPDAAKVLIRTQSQAIIAALGRRKGERFLREWARLLGDLDTVQALFPTNAARDRAAIADAQREAVTWFAQMSAILWGSIPRE